MFAPIERLHEEEVPVALLMVVLAAVACTVPAQADTFYHLRAGREMWESGRLLERELFSHVTYGQPHPNHWWLSQLAFYGLLSLGGPFFLTLAAGAFAWAAVVGAWRLTRGSSPETRLLLLLVLALCLPAWSVRPQVFSLVFMLLTIRIVLADRLEWLLPLIVIWANVHAVVVLGVAVAFVPLAEAVLWSHGRIRRTAAIAIASAAAPMISPLGIHYWPYVIKVVREARELGIHEYRSAFGLDVESVGLWLVVATTAALTVRAWPVLPRRDFRDRELLLASAVLAAAAILSLRNAAYFALAVVPTLARLIPRVRSPKDRPAPAVAVALIVLTIAAGAVGIWYRWRDGGSALGWKPFTPAAIGAIRACSPPMYNSFYDGGFLIWFVPEQRVFVDGRTDAYPLAFLRQATRASLRGEYRSLFEEYGIKCAVAEADSVMATALRNDPSMHLAFADPKWVVFESSD
jgi:hypothetical protein